METPSPRAGLADSETESEAETETETALGFFLFRACDRNGDGFVDVADLEAVCEGLRMGAVEPRTLLADLGAGPDGRLSYARFTATRKALRKEIAALKKEMNESKSEGDSDPKERERWEWDSGARDLETSPSPSPSPSPSSSSSPAGLHSAAVSSLKNEVLELSARLHAADRRRDLAEEALVLSRNECERLKSRAIACEERLTELHGVIAELRKSTAARDRDAIPESPEESGEGEEPETSCGDDSRLSDGGDAERTTSAADFEGADSPRRFESGAESPSTRDREDSAPDRAEGYAADSTSIEDETFETDGRRCDGERSKRRPPSRGPRNPERGRRSADIPDRIASARRSPRLRSRSDGVGGSPQMKIASRVRLRKTGEDRRLTGKDICREGVFSSAVAEHLARCTHGDLFEDEDEDLAGEERLVARMDRLEADNALLSATLKESKQHADRLSLACAQCSAEAGALRIALAAADRAVEAYDVLLALAETGQTEEGRQMRSATERVARQLLSKLDAEAAGHHRMEAGPGPWADAAAMLVYGADPEARWTDGDERALRCHVSRLKRERSVAASSAQPAPWPLQDDTDEGISSSRNSEKLRNLEPADTRRMDMETAVLMQEVMSLREERAELRARLRAARHSGGGGEDGECERRLLEALARENTLKTRMQRLMSTLHRTPPHTCQRCSNKDSGKEQSDDTDLHPPVSGSAPEDS